MEELKKLADGDWIRPSGHKKQLKLDDQVRNCNLYPSNCKKQEIPQAAQLNPDWTEWLMGWPIGWTDLRPLDKEGFAEWFKAMLSGRWWKTDPANEGKLSRVTENKANRANRIKALGNGQVPMCVYTATHNLSKIKEID